MQTTFDDIRPTRLIEQPIPRRPRKRGVSPRTAAITAVLFAAALAFLSGHDDPAPPQPAPAVVAPPASEWVDIEHPPTVFSLSAPEFAHGMQSYVARRNRFGGREDILTFGQIGGHEPFLHLTLYRLGHETVADVPFFVDLVRIGAAVDLAIAHSGNPAIVSTRFGPLETADVDLAAAAASPVPCLGFRGAGLEGTFRISGLACGTKARPVSRTALACFLDRLELDDSDKDPALAAYFTGTTRRPADCGGTGFGPGTTKTNWIDRNDAPPPLKLRKMR